MNLTEQIDVILDRWEDAHAAGEWLSLDDLCSGRPDLREEVQRRILALTEMEQRFNAGPGGVIEPPGRGCLPLEGEVLQVTTRITDLHLHASGGLGAVFRATDIDLQRELAVKLEQPAGSGATHEDRERFLAEAEITGRLDHPGIVPVYGLGHRASGQAFYVMRMIRGETLDAAIDRFHSASHQCRRVFDSREFKSLVQALIAVSKTVAYAHSRGILHLDVKPQNIMQGRYGETVLVDWGIALAVERGEGFRTTDEHTLVPRTGRSPDKSTSRGGGTPAYMSPEQVSGDKLPAPPADVFALGGTLYKILTGRPPYTGVRRPQPYPMVRDYPNPRSIRRGVPRLLESICLHAMEMDPGQRYRTALELAEDLERCLAGEAVHALRGTPREQVVRLMAGRGGWMRLALGATALIGLAGAALGWRAWTLSHARADALRTIESVQTEQLQASARYAADRFAREIESRWNALQRAAMSGVLHGRLRVDPSAGEDVDRRAQLQAWVDDQFIRHRDLDPASWILIAPDGVLLAVSPRQNGHPAKPDQSRFDYFHGRGRDLARGSPERAAPIDTPYLSTPFFDESTHALNIALSVPVWDETVSDASPVAVLVMSQAIGFLEGLQNAVLIDLREDWLERHPQSGLILQHPAIEPTAQIEKGRPPKNYRLAASQSHRLRAATSAADAPAHVAVLQNYQDPVTATAPCPAAYAPVVVRLRTDKGHADINTGLVVVLPAQPRVAYRKASSSQW